MGFFSADTEEIYPVWREKPGATQARGYLTDLMTKDVNLPTRQTAGMSANEQTGQSLLADILAGKSFQDPSTSQYYQGMRNQMKTATDEGAAALRHRQQLGGSFNSGAAVNQESKYRTGQNDQLMTLLGQLYEQERARDNEYTRLAASSQYGALPRLLEQQGMDSSYNAAQQNAMFPYQYQAPLASEIMQYFGSPWQMPTVVSNPSDFAQIVGPVAQMVGALSGSNIPTAQPTVTPAAAQPATNNGLPTNWGQYQPYQFPTVQPNNSFSLGQGYF